MPGLCATKSAQLGMSTRSHMPIPYRVAPGRTASPSRTGSIREPMGSRSLRQRDPTHLRGCAYLVGIPVRRRRDRSYAAKVASVMIISKTVV